MRVSSLHIERFGIFEDQAVPALSPGLNVFFGRNEAGKSTCLRFFRAMLFGYRRGRRLLDQPQGRAGGGSLLLETEVFGPVRLARAPGPHGGPLTLSGPGGEPLPGLEPQRLFSGLTEGVYDAIFAFSLRDLSHFSSLDGDAVRHALHGAAFGFVQSPARVLKLLDERMKELLKERGAAAVNTALRELEETRAALRDREPDVRVYEELRTALAGDERRLELLRAQRADRNRDLARLRRRLDLWQSWLEAEEARAELAALGPEAEKGAGANFTPDAVQRLEALMARQEERRLLRSGAHSAHDTLLAEIRVLEEPPPPSGLPELLAGAAALREERQSCRDAAQRLPDLTLQSARLAGEQAAFLARLGPGWNADRIASLDLSPTPLAEAARLAAAVAAAATALAEAERDLRRLQEEAAETAETETRQAGLQEAATRLSEDSTAPDLAPDADFPAAAELAECAASLAGARAALASLPGLRTRAEKTAQRADAALAALGPGWTGDRLAVFSLQDGQRLRQTAAGLAAARQADDDARRLSEHAGENTREAAARLEILQKNLAGRAALPDREEIERREEQLRRLRALEAHPENRHAPFPEPASGGTAAWSPASPPQLTALAGGQAALAGFALLLGGLAAGFPPFAYSGGALLLFGLLLWLAARLTPEAVKARIAALLLGRAPERTPDAPAGAEEPAGAKALADEYLTLARAVAAWSGLAPDGWNSEATGRAEGSLRGAALECLLRDRDAAAAAEADEHLRTAGKAAQAALERAEAAAQAVQEAETRWAAALETLGLESSFPPEEAPLLPGRVESAEALLAAADEAGETLAAARARIIDCLRGFAAHPYFAAAAWDADFPAPAVGASPESLAWADGAEPLLDGLARALAAAGARAAGAAEERRLLAVREERAEAKKRALARLEAAARERAEASARLEEERAAVAAFLAARGLPEDLPPEEAPLVLEAMRTFLEREKDAAALLAGQKASGRRVLAFAARCRDLALRAGLTVPERLRAGAPETAEIADIEDIQALFALALPLLDALSAFLDENAARRAALGHKREEAAARGRELAAAEEALRTAEADVAALLAAAGAKNPEDFRAAFARHARAEELRGKERSLLAGLRRLAAEEGVAQEAVLAEFESGSREELEEEDVRLAAFLAALEDEAAALAESVGRTREKLAALSGGEGSAPLRRREAALLTDIFAHSRRWAVAALARNLLLSAKRRFEEEGSEGVVRFAGDIFAAVTDGAYSGIAALEDGGFAAVHRSGKRLDPESELSRGTREQLYLALRLAYVRNHAAKAEAVPLILDDILVNFDAGRARATAAVLADFAVRNQMLFFTCHEETADLLLEAGRAAPDAGNRTAPALFGIERGVIGPLGGKGSRTAEPPSSSSRKGR